MGFDPLCTADQLLCNDGFRDMTQLTKILAFQITWTIAPAIPKETFRPLSSHQTTSATTKKPEGDRCHFTKPTKGSL